MKKILVCMAAAAALVITSCSSSDDNNPSTSTSGKMLATMAVADGSTYTFTYDDHKRISTIAENDGFGGNYVYTMGYEGTSNRLTTITETGDETGLVTLGYDSNHRLNSVNDNGTTTAISYTSGVYSTGDISWTLNSKGDLATVIADDVYTFSYDGNKKGAFSGTQTPLMLLGLIQFNDFLWFGSRGALTGADSVASDDYTVTNTYNSSNQPTTSVESLGGTAEETASFTYQP